MSLVEVSENLSTSVLSSCFVVIKDTSRGGPTRRRKVSRVNTFTIFDNWLSFYSQDNDTKRTSRQQLFDPLFNSS